MDDRRLDDEVAEKVMGWTLSKGSLGLGSTAINRKGGLAGIMLDAIPHYSTDIEAAWEVVEKIDAWNCEVTRQHEDSPAEYECILMMASKEDRSCWKGRFSAKAKTAPEAICRAALKAQESRP